MTTEGTREPPRTSALELRLYAVAILAAVYLVAWQTIATPVTAKPEPAHDEAAPVAARPAVAPATQRSVWLEDVPAAQRPPIVVPAGWHVVARTSPASAAAPQPRIQVVRVPASRPIRVRTRSS